jgi:hypothetical protein
MENIVVVIGAGQIGQAIAPAREGLKCERL